MYMIYKFIRNLFCKQQITLFQTGGKGTFSVNRKKVYL